MDAFELYAGYVWWITLLVLTVLWVWKHIIIAGQNHTIEDMELFWGVKFREDTSVLKSGEITKFYKALLRRAK